VELWHVPRDPIDPLRNSMCRNMHWRKESEGPHSPTHNWLGSQGPHEHLGQCEVTNLHRIDSFLFSSFLSLPAINSCKKLEY
jgi:hypothetical protein